MEIHEASAEELRSWDSLTVDPEGGHVYQSLAWGAYRATLGWRPRHLVFEDGFRLLSLERRWPIIGGSGAYLSKGPISGGEAVERTADRLFGAAAWLAGHGVDVVSSDAEIEASTGYAGVLESHGFDAIDEAQPSRHRMRLDLVGLDEAAAFRRFDMSLRQRVRGAERAGLRIVALGAQVPGAPEETGQDPAMRFERLYDLISSAAARRRFAVSPRAGFVAWSLAALAAGHLVYLEVEDRDGEMLGGATFYRHGHRLTYSHSGDRVELRRVHPGVIHLLLWRAIQLAIGQGLAELDLGGVDVRGARNLPLPGEPMYGLYAFKRSFGAEWVELAGNHEWVARRMHYLAGRATGRLFGLAAGPRRSSDPATSAGTASVPRGQTGAPPG